MKMRSLTSEDYTWILKGGCVLIGQLSMRSPKDRVLWLVSPFKICCNLGRTWWADWWIFIAKIAWKGALWRLRPDADYTIYINKITYNHIADTSVFRFLHCKQILFVKIITQYIWRTFTCMPTVHVHRFSRSLHSNRTFGRLICR